MKATGQLKFTKYPNGVISHEWIGGRRIIVTGELVESLTHERPRVGQLVTVQGITLRLITIEFATQGHGYKDSYIAMREGTLARFIWRYWQWLSAHASSLFAWECKWLRWRKPVKAETYPKWSLVGMLIRPLI